MIIQLIYWVNLYKQNKGYSTKREAQFCSTFFKIYLLFEYSSHDLEREILKRCVANRNFFSSYEMQKLTEDLINGLAFMQKN